jgi:hypothetical protein
MFTTSTGLSHQNPILDKLNTALCALLPEDTDFKSEVSVCIQQIAVAPPNSRFEDLAEWSKENAHDSGRFTELLTFLKPEIVQDILGDEGYLWYVLEHENQNMSIVDILETLHDFDDLLKNYKLELSSTFSILNNLQRTGVDKHYLEEAFYHHNENIPSSGYYSKLLKRDVINFIHRFCDLSERAIDQPPLFTADELQEYVRNEYTPSTWRTDSLVVLPCYVQNLRYESFEDPQWDTLKKYSYSAEVYIGNKPCVYICKKMQNEQGDQFLIPLMVASFFYYDRNTLMITQIQGSQIYTLDNQADPKKKKMEEHVHVDLAQIAIRAVMKITEELGYSKVVVLAAHNNPFQKSQKYPEGPSVEALKKKYDIPCEQIGHSTLDPTGNFIFQIPNKQDILEGACF